MNLLDIDKVFDECPCVCDSIRQIYIFGRFKKYHGISKKEIDDGTEGCFQVWIPRSFMILFKN